MSIEYDEYLKQHIRNVQNGLNWMNDNLDVDRDIRSAIGEALWRTHDESKYGTKEYRAYDAYFYGGNRSYKVVQDFNYAWLHHIHNNPHHWQYWVLINDDEKDGTVALEMPKTYVAEMIADWWTFSWKTGKLGDIFEWYDSHKDRIVMHKNTRKLVEDILDKIETKLIDTCCLKENWRDEKRQNTKVNFEEEPKVLEIDANTKEEPVEHSGVKGQEWGVRNGPPYPLHSNNVAEKIYSDAKNKIEKITNDVEDAAKRAGGKMYGLENKLKTKESIERKINKKVEEDSKSLTDAASDIKDAVRYTIIADSDKFVKMYNEFKDILLKEGYEETRCKNYFDLFNKGEVKHKAVQSNFITKDGYEFEIQFHTPESQDAKTKKIPLYNERRTVGIAEDRAKELEKQMEDLAYKIPDPIGIETIQSHSGHLKHSDINEDDEHKYGVPEIKKFPMPDADHVRSAIRFFNYIDPRHEKELAKAILGRAEEYGVNLSDMNIGDENRFKKYIPEENRNEK